jgi:hypothetical protein
MSSQSQVADQAVENLGPRVPIRESNGVNPNSAARLERLVIFSYVILKLAPLIAFTKMRNSRHRLRTKLYTANQPESDCDETSGRASESQYDEREANDLDARVGS